MSEDKCECCGAWINEGRRKWADADKLNPIYKTDFSKPLSQLIEEARNKISQVRGKEVRDKFLTEEAIGEIWEVEEWRDKFEWKKHYTNDFSSYEGFGKLIKWLKNTPHWQKIRWNMPMSEFMDLVADPDKAATRLYEYLKGIQK